MSCKAVLFSRLAVAPFIVIAYMPGVKYLLWSLCKSLIIFLFTILLLSCNKNNNDAFLQLNLLSQYHVDIPGISDLSSYMNENEFLAVSDTLGKAYVISATGELIRTLNYMGGDLEGVTFASIDSTIFVLEEKKKVVVKLDTNGNEILRFPVVVNNTYIKHGPEGITFNPSNEHLYVVNESSPSLLIEMTLSGEVIASNELNFAKDYSAVCYDPLDSSLWILSDDSELLAKCDLSGNPLKQCNTGIPKCEGLVVDSKHSRIYIISEQTSTLYTFSY